MGLLDNTSSQANTSLAGKTILIYGAPKVGKSTTSNTLPGNLFADLEGGLQFLSCNRVSISSWDDLLKLRDELVTVKHNFKNLTIDTVDLFHKYCERYIVKKAGAKDINDGELAYGKGGNRVKDEIINFLISLKQKGISVTLISHGKEREMSTKTAKWSYMGTTLGPSVETAMTALCDYIFYCYINEDGKRVMRTKPSKYVLAGDRSAKLPEIMEMDLNLIEKHLNKKDN
ncbi:MAG: hypothetical protein E6R04_08145 [Spirochaetes bacterium]|nr:MAG: hypothetical protein E6R04_08145 [Spirochaetota bacterium]